MQALPWIVSAALLVGIVADRVLLRQPPADAAPYHAHVQEVAATIPRHLGDWYGDDVPIPQGAVNLLKPNVLLSRRFEHRASGQMVTLLLVQCTDARSLEGHFPPACYPRQGWNAVLAEPRKWTVDDLEIAGTRYVFSAGQVLNPNEVTIDNFMVIPGGHTARDMDAVVSAAQDMRRRYFGAAQVQLVYGGRMTEDARDEARKTFVRMLRPAIDAIAQQDQLEDKSGREKP